jgi:hypothetical protein
MLNCLAKRFCTLVLSLVLFFRLSIAFTMTTELAQFSESTLQFSTLLVQAVEAPVADEAVEAAKAEVDDDAAEAEAKKAKEAAKLEAKKAKEAIASEREQ